MFFAYLPSFSGIVESFFTQTPSKYYLETITDSIFLRIPYTKHSQLIKEHWELETLFRKITEQFLIGIIERHHQLMAFNTETRLKKFCKKKSVFDKYAFTERDCFIFTNRPYELQ